VTWLVAVYNSVSAPAVGRSGFSKNSIETIGGALTGHPQLDGRRFANWIDRRHKQVDNGSLVYITHQLDVFGRVSS
jgi:hypothetical protein